MFSKHPEGELELVYFTDESKTKKKGVIDLTKFISIKPSVTVGGRDNLFALEIQGRTYIMQAANSSSKNVWLAKLYETLSGERVFHASIPQQTQLQAAELLMRAVSKTELLLVDPTSGQTIANIDYNTVRRHGNSGHVLWFEICPCSADELKVFLWTITAGAGMCAQVAKEIKLYIEQRNQKHMVAENITDGQIYTSQCHFTCPVPVTTTTGVPAQVRVMVKTKRRPTDLQRKGSEHCPPTSAASMNSPPPNSPRALGPNSRQNSFDSVFMNSPEGQNTLANFRERQFTFSVSDTHSPFDPSRSLANFRQNSQEAGIGSTSPLVEEKVTKAGSTGILNRSNSPYPVVGRDSGVESELELSPSNSRKLRQKDSISSTGSVASVHSTHSSQSVTSGEAGSTSPEAPDEISRLPGQPPVTPPRSEISLRMFTSSQRVAQTAS